VRPATGGSADAGGFVVGRCPQCRRDVLSYPEGDDPAAGQTHHCVHCDAILREALRWIDAPGLAALGYVVDSGAERGCGSCARGGCGVRSNP
jgi:hypothetical protein